MGRKAEAGVIYECDQCGKALPPGVVACPDCGEAFEDAVPQDAELPKKGFTAVVKPAPAPNFVPTPKPTHGGGYDWLEAPTLPEWPTENPSAKRLPNIRAIVVVWILICGGLAAGWVALSSHSDANPSDAASSSSTNGAQTSLAIGDDGVITTGDSSNVIVAATEQDEDDMTDAVVAKDKVGYAQIADSDRAYQVTSGTSAKLIGYGSGLMGAAVYHIRIQGGSHDTQDGWIPMEWMKKQ